jgi:low temperature requirement protein LtrA
MASPILRRHPRLRTADEETHYAAWLELFFDLVFVLAVTELAHYLHAHLTLRGFLGYTGLFVTVWWSWICFTFYADQFDPDDVLYRIVMLVAMLFTIALATSIPDALSEHTVLFVAAFICLQGLVIALYLWGARDTSARTFATRFAAGFIAGGALWLLSLFIPVPGRYAAWMLALAIEIGTPLVVSMTITAQPQYASHIPERFGLFTLIVLGESIVVVGTGIAGTHWQAASVVTAVGGFVIAACLWWLYFDRVDTVVIARAMTGGWRDIVRSYLWSYTHLLVFVGLTAASVGMEAAITPREEPSLMARVSLCAAESV